MGKKASSNYLDYCNQAYRITNSKIKQLINIR